jgi:carbamoyl-phosphate synthase large subunit
MAVTVLVSGGGGAAAISTIKALRMGGFDGRIVSTDAERLSAGLYLADAFRVVPRAKDPAFYPAVLRLIEDEHNGIIFPTSGFDIYEFARHKRDLEAMGVVVAMSDADAMATCENKWQFYLKTQGVFPLPETGRDAKTWNLFPCFVKPVFGKGSRDTHLCATREELEFHTSPARDMLIQEYLPGEEYTVDVLSDLSGAPLLAVPRARLETKDGISSKGRVFRDEEMERLCLELARHLGKGPTCMQSRRRGGAPQVHGGQSPDRRREHVHDARRGQYPDASLAADCGHGTCSPEGQGNRRLAVLRRGRPRQP